MSPDSPDGHFAGEQLIYGLIGKKVAVEHQRIALFDAILDGSDAMPGCLSSIGAKDAVAPHAIWITEVWETQADHEASHSLSGVQAATQLATPLIAGRKEASSPNPCAAVV